MFPDVANVNVGDQLDMLKKGAGYAVNIHSRTAYVFVMSMLIKQNIEEKVNQFYKLLKLLFDRRLSSNIERPLIIGLNVLKGNRNFYVNTILSGDVNWNASIAVMKNYCLAAIQFSEVNV
jgi:hypothetical protein